MVHSLGINTNEKGCGWAEFGARQRMSRCIPRSSEPLCPPSPPKKKEHTKECEAKIECLAYMFHLSISYWMTGKLMENRKILSKKMVNWTLLVVIYRIFPSPETIYEMKLQTYFRKKLPAKNLFQSHIQISKTLQRGTRVLYNLNLVQYGSCL